MFHCKCYSTIILIILFICGCENISKNQIQDDLKTVDTSENEQKTISSKKFSNDPQAKFKKAVYQSKILDKQFFSKSDWIYVPEGISNTELLEIVKKAVDKRIVENYKRPTRFSEIPSIEKSWLNKKRVELAKYISQSSS